MGKNLQLSRAKTARCGLYELGEHIRNIREVQGISLVQLDTEHHASFDWQSANDQRRCMLAARTRSNYKSSSIRDFAEPERTLHISNERCVVGMGPPVDFPATWKRRQ